VIRRFILIVLAVLVTLAAGLMTAIFIFRYPTPLEFKQASANQPVQFPRDEAAHFEAQTEWWYYTGFLAGEDGQRYGFELVFFKAYVPPQVRIAGVLPLKWSNNPIYFAHFAVSDLETGEHVFTEQVNSPQFWDASAREDRYEVRNGDWRAWGSEGKHQLQATSGRYGLRLALGSAKPPALHGPEGAGVVNMGQAGTSYYYSEPDLTGAGFFYIDGERQVVQAEAWMDHQWGSWRSHDGYAGWDWFSLRLDDGSRVMLFNFRDKAGSLEPAGAVQPESAGTWIAADGSTQHLSSGDYTIEVLEWWTSPDTAASYPVKWRLAVPGHDLDVVVAADSPEQEMPIQFGPVYWEGSVAVSGTATGTGFVEMTGYKEAGQ
jgi:predicted secreted hydrolase